MKAFVCLTEDYKDKGGEGLIKELQDHVKRTTAPYKYPRKARFMIYVTSDLCAENFSRLSLLD